MKAIHRETIFWVLIAVVLVVCIGTFCTGCAATKAAFQTNADVEANLIKFIQSKKLTTNIGDVKKAVIEYGTPVWVQVAGMGLVSAVFITVIRILSINRQQTAILKNGRAH